MTSSPSFLPSCCLLFFPFCGSCPLYVLVFCPCLLSSRLLGLFSFFASFLLFPLTSSFLFSLSPLPVSSLFLVLLSLSVPFLVCLLSVFHFLISSRDLVYILSLFPFLAFSLLHMSFPSSLSLSPASSPLLVSQRVVFCIKGSVHIKHTVHSFHAVCFCSVT